MDTRQAMHSTQAKTLDTEGLRRQFLIEEVFRPGEMTMTYSHIDQPGRTKHHSHDPRKHTRWPNQIGTRPLQSEFSQKSVTRALAKPRQASPYGLGAPVGCAQASVGGAPATCHNICML